jgi:hypothetical protein
MEDHKGNNDESSQNSTDSEDFDDPEDATETNQRFKRTDDDVQPAFVASPSLTSSGPIGIVLLTPP